jgi:uncharacterized protein (TIGR02246 family)
VRGSSTRGEFVRDATGAVTISSPRNGFGFEPEEMETIEGLKRKGRGAQTSIPLSLLTYSCHSGMLVFVDSRLPPFPRRPSRSLVPSVPHTQCKKMKNLFLVSLALLFLTARYGAAGVVAATSPTAADAKAEVIAAFQASVAAAEALDVDSLVGVLAENDHGALAINGRLILTRREAIENTRANFRGIRKIKYDISPPQVTLLAADAALLVANGTVTVETEAGQTFTRAFAHTIVYQRHDGAWQVLHSHQSNPPADTRP